MKIIGFQGNPVVGDVQGNLALAKSTISHLQNEQPDLIVFSELFLTGYPPRDLLFRSDLVTQNLAAKEELVRLTESMNAAIAFGYVERNPSDGAKGLYNAVCVAQKGRILQQRYKTLLPTYDVFEERRYFHPGGNENIQPVNINGTQVGIIICEEGWNDKFFWPTHEYPLDPVELIIQRGARYIVSINASPFRMEGDSPIGDTRIKMMSKHCERHGVGCIYVNQVGANDEIVFDGNSFALNSMGEVAAHSLNFSPDLIFGSDEFEPKLTDTAYKQDPEAYVLQALILGVSDYFDKQPFFRRAPAFIGLSGGIDSALTAWIAAQAIGKHRIVGVGMPRQGISSAGSVSDAESLAHKLGIQFIEMPIGDMHDAAREMLDHGNMQLFNRQNKNEDSNSELFGRKFVRCENAGVTDENQQARLRGLNLMSLANYYNGIVLTTGNKSEMAVGYCTIYGDMCGGLAVIADVYKTWVFRLCKYINKHARDEIIPWNTINKPPSAELRVNQTDQQSLPPYEVLDAILERFVDEQKSFDQVQKEVTELFNETEYGSKTQQETGKPRSLKDDIIWTCNAVFRNEYKRKQGAPGIKVTRKHWKYGWHMPIVHRMKLG